MRYKSKNHLFTHDANIFEFVATFLRIHSVKGALTQAESIADLLPTSGGRD